MLHRPSRLFRAYLHLWNGIDWLFPPSCGGCNRPGYRWCPTCARMTTPLPEPLCELCGFPLPSSGRCAACRKTPPPFRALRSWSAFAGPLRKAILRLKYRYDPGLAAALVEHMFPYIASLPWPKADLIVPIPLSPKRHRQRGYNQVELPARALALALGWTCQPEALARVRETASQVGLSAEERRRNVQDAFRADPALVRGRIVLLIDDVATTGATLSACAQALLEADAAAVYALTLARALPEHHLDHPNPIEP